MIENTTNGKSCNDQSLSEVVDSLTQITLADDTIECQICNETLTDGDEVVCHLQSPTAATNYEVAQIRCQTHGETAENLLTLGVDELIVEGRVGCCSDQATQSSWPVLLTPQIRMVSSASTATAQPVETKEPQTESKPDSTKDTVADHHGQPTDDETPDTEFETLTLDRWDPTLNGGTQ